MSAPINQQTASGIDATARARFDDDRQVSGTVDAQAWFASELIAPGTIALPTCQAGCGIQDLNRLVDGILAPIDA